MKKLCITACCFALLLLTGCSSTTSVTVSHNFPKATLKPLNVNAAIVFDDSFSSYTARPDAKTTIQMGEAQTQLLSNIFEAMFQAVEFVSSVDDISENTELIVVFGVHEVQVSNPSINYLNVFEVWIKYRLDISTADGTPLVSWSMPAYGKTPDSFMLSKGDAIQEATIVALRDIGANLAMDFHRIPAVKNWLKEQQRLTTETEASP